ncbi:MAG: hypothetical protein K2L99_06375 [Muribaculaceae bacterium]|nr:hypothetical protein [Muribaculaceae bacterium]
MWEWPCAEHGCALRFISIFQDLLLGLIKGVAVALERSGLAVHHFAQHRGNLRGIFL